MDEGLTIEEAVIQVFAETTVEDHVPLTHDTTFVDLGVTKKDLVLAVIRLEEAFGTEVPIEEEVLFKQGSGTLGDLVRKCRLYVPHDARVRGPRKKSKKRWRLGVFGL